MLCKTIFLLVIAHLTIGAVIEAPVDYSQHKIIRILPNRINQLDVLDKIKTNFNVDFWNHPMADLRPVLTLLGPKQMDFLSALNNSNIRYEVAAHNFQKVIDAEREENQLNREMFNTKAFDYENVYHTYPEIVAEMQSICDGSKCKYGSVGTTYEGRSIPYVTIGSGKAVFLECGIHSREWVSTASCLWIMNELINNPALSYLTDKFEFIIVPTLNSDGYVYTHSTDRMWRKTRTPQSGNCYGADPNRNWDTAFCQQGASTNPCSETYCGKAAFSEPCAKAMSEMIKTKPDIAAYFAIHSYSQIWMYPWGYTKTLPPNSPLLDSLSTAACDAIKSTNGLSFTKGSIANAIYLASGSSIDWAYDNAGAKIAFALELRDTGRYGFVLPPDQIKPACEETWAGIKAVLDKL